MSLARRVRFRLATSVPFERAVRAVPAAERAAWRRARRYVAGRDPVDALAVVRRLAAAGMHASVDLFGERVQDGARARAVADAYLRLADGLMNAPSGTWLSIDLSHIAFDGGLLEEIAATLPAGCRLQVGAEEAAVADRVLDLVLEAIGHGLPVDATLEANLRRAPADAERLASAGAGVRLVKGAYVESPRDALPWGREVDEAYAALARMLGSGGARVALATHDAPLRELVLRDVEVDACEMLLGVRSADAVELVRAGRRVRIYVPFGEDWFRYLMRRRAEAEGAG
jgi:proline dehydrogenase